MANLLNKFRVKTAVGRKTPLDLSCDHITSMNFMSAQPIYKRQLVPGDHISVNCESLAYLDPVLKPVFGRATLNLRAFFVPFRTVYKIWNDFITDTVANTGLGSGVPQSVPSFAAHELIALLKGNTYSAITTTPQNGYDFYYDNNGTPVYYILTKKGRDFRKILQSLGYQIPVCGVDSHNEQMFLYSFNALPLLAYTKVWFDWYIPSQYVGASNDFNDIAQILNSDGAALLTSSELNKISNFLDYVCYDADYFVNAFDRPVGPNSNNQYSTISIRDLTDNATNYSVVDNSQQNGTPNIVGVSGGGSTTYPVRLTQYMLDALKSLNDFMKRHQLAGARALDRYLARYGKQLSSEKLNRSNYIGSVRVPIQFGAVDSNSATSDASLGDYAGKGRLFMDNPYQFDFSTDEYGEFIIVGSVVPSVGYVQGIDRECLATSKFDFWLPEYDSIGNEAVSSSELYVPHSPQFQGYYNIVKQVFGFVPRYASYKIPYDRVTGDMSLPTQLENSAWHTMRMFDDASFNNNVTHVTHKKDFVVGSDSNIYNRIFYANEGDAGKYDHIKVLHRFHVQLETQMHSLYDTYDFKDDDYHHEDVIVEGNGTKAN